MRQYFAAELRKASHAWNDSRVFVDQGAEALFRNRRAPYVSQNIVKLKLSFACSIFKSLFNEIMHKSSKIFVEHALYVARKQFRTQV